MEKRKKKKKENGLVRVATQYVPNGNLLVGCRNQTACFDTSCSVVQALSFLVEKKLCVTGGRLEHGPFSDSLQKESLPLSLEK